MSWCCLGNKQDKLALPGPSAASVACVWSVYSPWGFSLGNKGCESSGSVLNHGCLLLLLRWNQGDSSLCSAGAG